MKLFEKITFPPNDSSEAGPWRNSRLYEAFPNVFPIFTYLVIVWCCVLYYMVFAAGEDWIEVHSKFGGIIYMNPYHEPFWKLLTTCFFHDPTFMMHLLFNMMWIFSLAPLMERGIGTFKTVLFFVATGFVSSAISTSISEVPGVGMSGIVYAIVGFMWTAWPRWTGFLEKFNGQTVKLLIFWQLICFLITWSDGYNIWMLLTLSFTMFGIVCALRPMSQWF